MHTESKNIRWAIRKDTDAIQRICEDCFDDPHTKKELIQLLKCRNVIGLVVNDDDDEETTVGYTVYALEKKVLDVVYFAIDPERHREGFGTKLLNHLKAKLSPERRTRLSIQVCEKNLAALMFLKAAGFRARRVHRDAYEFEDGTALDAYDMTYRLNEPAANDPITQNRIT